MSDRYSFGIEEEFFLADVRTGRSPSEAAAARFHEAAAAAVPNASPELLVGQVEIHTEPETDFDVAYAALRAMRGDLARVAADHGLSLLAAGSHPLAEPEDQRVTDKTRYKRLAGKVGAMAERAIVCAMHVHVELPEPDRRIEIMNRVLPFLPLLLALSVSSPFWQGRDTSLKGFRLAAFSEWPHMGLPVRFDSKQDYDRFIAVLVAARVVPDASYVWWLIRPSAHYPTLELRVCDSCTRAEDAVAIAALYRCLVCAAARRPELNADVGAVDWGVATEDIWQVQRHGLDARLIDARRQNPMSVRASLEAAIALVAEEAEMLGASAWVARTRDILVRGAGADRQLAAYHAAQADGADHDEAVRAVTQMIAAETLL